MPTVLHFSPTLNSRHYPLVPHVAGPTPPDIGSPIVFNPTTRPISPGPISQIALFGIGVGDADALWWCSVCRHWGVGVHSQGG
eukprot:750378-Hanusia_phi.AAC.2